MTDRNDIYRRSVFHDGGWGYQAGIRKAAEFMAVHFRAGSEDKEAFEREFFDEIARASDAGPDGLRVATNPLNWNIERLSQGPKTTDARKKTLRKPKVVVNVAVTKAGNLSASWLPERGHVADFTYHRDDYGKTPFERPMNEFAFIRGFAQAANAHRFKATADEQRWRQALRLRLADKAIDLVEGLIDEMSEFCEVRLGLRIKADRDSHGLITGWKVETAEMALAREQAEYERSDEARRQAVRDRLAKAGKEYGIEPARLVALADALRQHAIPHEEVAGILASSFGLKVAFQDFPAAVRLLRKDLKAAGMEPEEMFFTRQQVKALPAGNRRPAPSPIRAAAAGGRRGGKAGRQLPADRPDPMQVPDYSRARPYAASQEELADAGVQSVGELVESVNQALLSCGRFPVSQADYPNTKSRFERLVKIWATLREENAMRHGV